MNTKITLRFMLAIVMLSIIAVCINGCSNELKRGQVVDKWYEPDRTYIAFMPMRIGKMTTLIPYIIHDTEDYCISVTGYNTDNEKITETFYITPERYQCVSIGDDIVIGDSCYTDDSNNTRQRK